MSTRKGRPLRDFYIYTADAVQTVRANSLPRAVKLSGIDESKTRILAAFDAACVPQYRAPESPLVAVVLRNMNAAQEDDES